MNNPFLRSHLAIPLLAFAVVFAALEFGRLDPLIARAWYFDEASLHWIGAGPGAWWARELLHTGGRWFVRGIVAASLLVYVSSFALAAARPWRRAAGFVVFAMVSATVVVGALKLVTNVDCPWDLAGFGGTQPYVPLFADRPAGLPQARCFPGAHASSGFALLAFYFPLRDPRPRLARWALGLAIGVGVVFSIGQEARGAHFLTHDLASAALVWFIQLALYGWLLRPPAPARALASRAPAASRGAAHPTAAT